MASFTTTTISLGPSARVLRVSEDDRYVSYVETSGAQQTLFVLDLNTGATTQVDSYTSIHIAAGGFSSDSGIGGGVLSANGRFIFYSTGLVDGNIANGTQVQFFIKDLRAGTPAVEVTPQITFPGGIGGLLGMTPEAISNDGQTIVYGKDFTAFGDVSSNGNFLVAENLTTGDEQQFNSLEPETAHLTPDGRYLTYIALPNYYVADLQAHTQTQYFESLAGGSTSDDGRYAIYSAGDGTSPHPVETFFHDRDAPPGTPDKPLAAVATNAQGDIANAPVGGTIRAGCAR
jgi:Tol biopolymer transport system component